MSGKMPGQSNALEVLVPAIVFVVVTPVFVGLRFWARTRVSNRIGLDDLTILVSFVFAMAMCCLMIGASHFGLGKHIIDLTTPNKKIALQLFYVAKIFYKVNINVTKISILLLYIRVFLQKPFAIACCLTIGGISAYGSASIAASIFQCNPIPRAWDSDTPGTCINLATNWYANAGFAIGTDVVILLLALPIIYSLNIPKGQRMSLVFVFALGACVVATSVLRVMTLDVSSTGRDETYEVTSSMWTIIEANIIIICACLPACRHPLSTIFPMLRNSKTRSQNAFSYMSSGKNDWSPYDSKEENVLAQIRSINPSTNARPSEGLALPKIDEESDVKYDAGIRRGCAV